MAAHLIV